ncbi:MAG: bifunctional folylpolyglutamate synthase/dihydrofolate synthase [Candidatus Omnitrophica bacterium]|nr:bifunctional folylpolyglutamate synthase/dihydrofolate synthase [Candidatus Omnitrophota bacterium]
MNYQEAINYLNSFTDYEKTTDYVYKDMTLDRVKSLLKKLDNPHKKFRSVQIAGTKGKGSTCAFIFSVLKEAGYKVGLYTSPHLIDFKERIKISYEDDMAEFRERLIDQNEVSELVEEIKPHADEIKGLTFFEVYTVLAFLFFVRQRIELAVLETGMGGRLDATNVVDSLVCAFSNISMDHIAMLGDTVEKIAMEKTGIIKDNSLVVSVAQHPQAWRVIEAVCKEKNVRYYRVGKDFIYDVIGQNLDGSIFDFKGNTDSYQNLHIGLVGPFQILNAALALSVIQLLRQHEIVISSLAVKKGMENAHWPGRMHIVHRNPFLVFDGAQNPASAHALRAAVNMLFIPKKAILIFGVSKDKDVRGMIPHIARSQNLIILTKSNNPRAMDVDTLEQKMFQFKRIIKKTKTIQEALNLAIENTSNKDDLILVAGSLYLIGEAYIALKDLRIPKY